MWTRLANGGIGRFDAGEGGGHGRPRGEGGRRAGGRKGRRRCRHVGVAFVFAALFTFEPATEAQVADGRRTALVIGNSAYLHTEPLRNPLNDAEDVGAALTGLGFAVTVKKDLGRAALYDAVADFGQSAGARAEIAILFYAGHGIEVNGTSYLVPVDARLARDTDTHQAMSLDDVWERLGGEGLRLVILDACRDNPLVEGMRRSDPTRSLSRSSGLGPLFTDQLGGTLVWYATKAGATAPDGRERNSPFTRALLSHLDDQVDIGTVFSRIAGTVYTETGGRQEPVIYGRPREYYLNGKDSVSPLSPPPPAQETVFWQSIVNSTNPADFKAYLAKWPDGTFASLARNRLADSPRPGEVFRDCPSCPEMVVIAAGAFRMGSPASEEAREGDEGPQHRVTLRSFALGVTEVTFDEWEACMRGGGCGWHRPDDEGWGRGARPVINVNWEDARAYVRWLSRETGKSYRLPSEAEWEYAARAGTTTPFHTGATISTDQANYDGSSMYGSGRRGTRRGRTTPVGTFAPNAFGLYDVHGNVWEWVEDCWHDSYRGAPSDGSAWTLGGDCSRRVLRGGSWSTDPRLLRSASRLRITTGNRLNHVGFRVARMLD